MSGTSTGSLISTLRRMREILDGVRDVLVDDWDPLELGLLFSKLEYEDLNVSEHLSKYQDLAKELSLKCSPNEKLRLQTENALKAFHETLGFSGDKANYYNIKNSFLNDVYLRRKGIPISLSLVFMGLCRLNRLKAVGISFPGHFLVRMVPTEGYFEASGGREVAEDWRARWYVDCFDASILNVRDCEERLTQWTRGAIPFGPDVLKLAHPVDILSRMLRNLRAILMEKEDLPRLYWVLTALIELCPSDRVEGFRERGLLLGRMGSFKAACADFREYLSIANEDVEKMNHVRKLLGLFENQSEFAN